MERTTLRTGTQLSNDSRSSLITKKRRDTVGQTGSSHRAERWRFAVFIAVVGLHLFVGFLILAAPKARIPTSRPEQFVPLTFLSFTEPHRPTSDFSTSQAVPVGPKPMVEPSVAAPALNNAITLPSVDWGAEADGAAQRRIDNEETTRHRRNLAGPSDSQLDWARNNIPFVSEHHKLGDSERPGDGEVITWENDNCYWTTHGITTFGTPQPLKVCKDPPKPDTALFKEMRKNLDGHSSIP